jgi:gamma-glutamyltranspeptidase/glutathione hydrolase
MIHSRAHILVQLAAALAFGSCAFAQEASLPPPPEAASGTASKQAVHAKDWMVAAAHPLAVEAGAKVLRAGGSAADAAIAVQLVLGLVEPQSSGLGGGAFVLYWDATAKKLTSFDARETAPMEAVPTLFQNAGGEPLTFNEAVIGGRSVGTPGTPRLLETLHLTFGKRPWDSLFSEAIRLADEGFAISPRLAMQIAGDVESLKKIPETASYFLDNGAPRPAGSRLKNPDYARTLRLLAERGADAFYSGPLAQDIVRTVRSAPVNAGLLSLDDLRTYRVKQRDPVCTPYRNKNICGMGPPSSGALTVGQILRTIERFDLKTLGPDDPKSWQIIADASRLAFADRERFMADSDFVPVPVRGLLADEYIAERSALLVEGSRLAEAKPGNPKFSHAQLFSDGRSPELPSTSHITIVDRDGNVVSMTTTIETGFGSRLFVRGFLLNNELTDFSFATHTDGVPVANRVEPGKRPRSSMAPTIVFENDNPILALGSPGGSQIIGYVAKTLIASIDWNMDIQAAIALPNILNRFGVMEIEQASPAEALAPALQTMGYETKIAPMTSGLHGIAIARDGLTGGADPRREGVAVGD